MLCRVLFRLAELELYCRVPLTGLARLTPAFRPISTTPGTNSGMPGAEVEASVVSSCFCCAGWRLAAFTFSFPLKEAKTKETNRMILAKVFIVVCFLFIIYLPFSISQYEYSQCFTRNV